MNRPLAIVVLVLVACGRPMPTPPGQAPAEPGMIRDDAAVDGVEPATHGANATQPDATSCATLAAPYDVERLRDEVTWLASPALDGRAPGSDGDRAARAFVVERFRCLGLVGAFDGDYEQPFTVNDVDTANVVGLIPGTDPDVGDEIIFVGAHLDHLGDGHLGANDNASGVAALLAVAQAVAQRATSPRRTIAFGVFGAEERGMRGSYHFVANPPASLPVARTVQFINLDMVGTHGGRRLVAAMGTFRGLAATPVVAALDDDFPRLRVVLGGVSRGSDFEPFCKRGVPYVFFWTPDPGCYHRRCDTADRLDYVRLADIAQLAGVTSAQLADASTDLAAVRARRGCGLPRR